MCSKVKTLLRNKTIVKNHEYRSEKVGHKIKQCWMMSPSHCILIFYTILVYKLKTIIWNRYLKEILVHWFSSIFTVRAFHLKWSELPLDNNVKKWAVGVISLDRNKRHLDRANLQMIWESLDRWSTAFVTCLLFSIETLTEWGDNGIVIAWYH